MRPQECELSAQLLHGGITPWSKPTAGIQEYSANTHKERIDFGTALLSGQIFIMGLFTLIDKPFPTYFCYGY